MAKRRRGCSFGALKMKRCPHAGTRLMFAPNPVSRLLYGHKTRLPKAGEIGTVTTVPGMARYGSCLGGPGGGLVFVKWPSVGTLGVSPHDLDKVRR